jgi:hypothetical protein
MGKRKGKDEKQRELYGMILEARKKGEGLALSAAQLKMVFPSMDKLVVASFSEDMKYILGLLSDMGSAVRPLNSDDGKACKTLLELGLVDKGREWAPKGSIAIECNAAGNKLIRSVPK